MPSGYLRTGDWWELSCATLSGGVSSACERRRALLREREFHGSGPNPAESRTAAKMGGSPKYGETSANKMAANVMESWTQSGGLAGTGVSR